MKFSIFTKPWKTTPIDNLCEKISNWGFDGIELPIRPGFQVEPKNAEKELPALAKKASQYGLSIMSVASPPEENIFAACQAVGIPLIRIMADFYPPKSYQDCENDFRASLSRLQPLCDKYNIKIGVQNHFGPMMINSVALKRLIKGFTPHIGAVWDAAHSGLAGEHAAQGLEVIWDDLLLVNLKNAYWKQTNGPEAKSAAWYPYFTAGQYGMASYPHIIDYLNTHNYKGDICLPAEYTDESFIDELVPEELKYVKHLISRRIA
ncbi:MAG: sugar phosphate isomerase/epimerase [Defluviitaleaceae bacterium]|nr:sugar phosphate isomerase/epimerase [Defluviitaleaceae bacterium]